MRIVREEVGERRKEYPFKCTYEACDKKYMRNPTLIILLFLKQTLDQKNYLVFSNKKWWYSEHNFFWVFLCLENMSLYLGSNFILKDTLIISRYILNIFE